MTLNKTQKWRLPKVYLPYHSIEIDVRVRGRAKGAFPVPETIAQARGA